MRLQRTVRGVQGFTPCVGNLKDASRELFQRRESFAYRLMGRARPVRLLFCCAAAAGVAIAFVPSLALAQSAPSNASESSTSASAGQLEEVVVTAERRPERLQDVPIAV